MAKKKEKAMWGGRFAAEVAAAVRDFSQSVSYDRRLYAQDIRGSVAHARMLRRAGLLTAGELRAIEKGLGEIRAEIGAGKFAWSVEREDVHMNIEAALTARTPAGAKLHTGRSRNDQVATDLRLWVKEETDLLCGELRVLQGALVSLGQCHEDVLIPGYTHLQRGQPALLAHHLLAYVEMLERDAGRFRDARERADELPLGSGALAGSTLPLDRESVARELGFSRVTQNSFDAVGDRDFVVEFCAAAALLAVHLSRLAEDLVLWSSAEFGFVKIGDEYTTGSSLMPQKKNPDVAELVRGKTGRVAGNLMSLLVLLKGLPLTYNRDLQEDKERLFDTADTVRACLRLMAGMLGKVAVQGDRCLMAVSDPALLATDVADALVLEGVPFREAHEIVGRAVALAERQRVALDRLDLKDWRAIDRRVTAACLEVFDPRRALERRKMTGAPSPAQVKRQLARWWKILGAGKGA